MLIMMIGRHRLAIHGDITGYRALEIDLQILLSLSVEIDGCHTCHRVIAHGRDMEGEGIMDVRECRFPLDSKGMTYTILNCHFLGATTREKCQTDDADEDGR